MELELSLHQNGCLMSITPISTPVTVVLPKLSDADQKKFDQVKQNLQSALDTLKSSKTSISDASAQRKAQQKAQAQQRIAQIKQSIKALRQFHGLDPKATARMVAQLAKQLAQAVKDYQSAGGSDASVSSGASTSDVSGSSSTASSVPAADTAATSSPTPESKAATAYGQTQQITVATDSNAQQDSAFINDVNQIKNDLRNFAKQLRNSLKTKFMPEGLDPDLKDVNAADKALDEVDKSLTQIGK
jgi:hypothetical protein